MNDLVRQNEKKARLAGMVRRCEQKLLSLLPRGYQIDRLERVVLNACARVPKLLEAEPATIMQSLFDCVSLGILPELGHAYLVPFRSTKRKRLECQFILGYKGMILLSHRSTCVDAVWSRAAYERDEFIWEEGTNPGIIHRPYMRGDRGSLIATYGCARMSGSGYIQHYVCDLPEIEATKSRSQTGAKGYGPWEDDYVAMAMKTAIRRLCTKQLPLQSEDPLARGIELEHDQYRAARSADIIPVEMTEHIEEPEVHGQLIEPPKAPAPATDPRPEAHDSSSHDLLQRMDRAINDGKGDEMAPYAVAQAVIQQMDEPQLQAAGYPFEVASLAQLEEWADSLLEPEQVRTLFLTSGVAPEEIADPVNLPILLVHFWRHTRIGSKLRGSWGELRNIARRVLA